MKICPCCGGALRSGFAQTGQRLCWKWKEQKFMSIPREDEGEFYLRGTSDWKGSVCPGFYCPDCRMIYLPQKEDDEV